jgi:hypothetical protein
LPCPTLRTGKATAQCAQAKQVTACLASCFEIGRIHQNGETRMSLRLKAPGIQGSAGTFTVMVMLHQKSEKNSGVKTNKIGLQGSSSVIFRGDHAQQHKYHRQDCCNPWVRRRAGTALPLVPAYGLDWVLSPAPYAGSPERCAPCAHCRPARRSSCGFSNLE